MKHKISIIFSLFLFNLLPLQTMAEGPIGSTGGNICKIGHKTVLLDFDGMESKTLNFDSFGEQIEFEPKYQKAGFKPAPVYSGRIKQKVDEILDRHNNHHLVRVLKTALNALVMFGVPKLFTKPLGADFSRAVNCNQNNTHVVMGYLNSMVFISIPAWNELSLMTQAGLLIHEGVRTLQKIYQLNLDDRALQDFTAALFADDPKKFTSLLGPVYELMSPKLKELNVQFLSYAKNLVAARKMPPSWVADLNAHQSQSSETQEAFLMQLAGTFDSPLSSDEVIKLSDLHHAIIVKRALINISLNSVSLYLVWMVGVRSELYEGLEDFAIAPEQSLGSFETQTSRGKNLVEIGAHVNSFK
ncbi:MAG: hypothetical protein JNM39_05665 [Bdellovibrionaceae bacterium]|nr:hypothetical protein [Pseudobdellovibrionaceae bacterium]